ncbi:hypothetical protein HOP50_11g63390 [Chloropicon primus]|uniref:K Homology domain-containing protein n=1 Tax=Chloropicon primus TaxID=1764295 RepID=A0A5B8MT00_9CHLO|nr:hypothetical protein A3770_11p63170 [Chloropicon primus]UPR03012.1 hypothetical protein HOP50_11g63390 [Chloropicon primus]|mmetsp:Transcript_12554/g.34995  ORF Transcript_12554/g.34995 Transcript_12554/m.34995 type:complete len:180 (+) Transcript_12554:1345-1884(+)|eukprot:QDZ23799.1 hypothetical protein A3770_11p63170 [Chloropicon primus]
MGNACGSPCCCCLTWSRAQRELALAGIPLEVSSSESGAAFARIEKHRDAILITVTLNAGVFVVGPNAACIRRIDDIAGTITYTYRKAPDAVVPRMTTVFYITGRKREKQRAVDIIFRAVQVYKDLTEGKYKDRTVEAFHKISGVSFKYQRPLRTSYPDAAEVEPGPTRTRDHDAAEEDA